jgi:hypothetical protein
MLACNNQAPPSMNTDSANTPINVRRTNQLAGRNSAAGRAGALSAVPFCGMWLTKHLFKVRLRCLYTEAKAA